jgi:hypothetical protein
MTLKYPLCAIRSSLEVKHAHDRRDFLHTSGALALTPAAMKTAEARVRVHNWDKYDFGSGPPVKDRLNQGPFPQYPPDASIPNDDVVMTTTPSHQVVPGFGKGLIIYITADMGTAEINSLEWHGR